MEKKKSEVDRAEEMMIPALKAMGFSLRTLGKFFVYAAKAHDDNEKLALSVDGGARRCRTNTNLRRICLNTRTDLVACILNSHRHSDELLPGDLDQIMKRRVNEDILTFVDFKTLRKNLRKAFILLVDMNASQYNILSYWRKALEVFRVHLYMNGQDDYTEDIQQANLFLKILETTK